MYDLFSFSRVQKRGYIGSVLEAKKVVIYLEIMVGDPGLHSGNWALTDADALPTITMYDSDDVEVLAAIPMVKLSDGKYAYEWDTAANSVGKYQWVMDATITDTITMSTTDYGHVLIIDNSTLGQIVEVRSEVGALTNDPSISDYEIYKAIARATSHVTGVKNSSALVHDVNDCIYSWAAYESYYKYMIQRQLDGIEDSDLDAAKLFELRRQRDRALAKIMQGDEIADTGNIMHMPAYTMWE